LGESAIETRAVPPIEESTAAGEDRLRSYIYALIGRLLGEAPAAETLELLSVVESQPAEKDELGRAWAGLQNAARDASAEALADEYQALFIGLGRGELVPFGSFYLTGFLMERPLVALREDLARLGFERNEDVKEPEDHAAILCEVMAALSDEDGGFDFATRADFFRRHIGPWMGRFFADLTTADAADFYRAVGEFGRQFMEIEVEYYGKRPAVNALTREAVLRPITVTRDTPDAG
jgi:TorA maturation chaperone TorD